MHLSFFSLWDDVAFLESLLACPFHTVILLDNSAKRQLNLLKIAIDG